MLTMFSKSKMRIAKNIGSRPKAQTPPHYFPKVTHRLVEFEIHFFLRTVYAQEILLESVN